MKEVWLRANRRVLLLSMIPASAIGVIGVILVAKTEGAVGRGFAWTLIVVGLFLLLGLVNQVRRPRIAYQDGRVLFNLRAGDAVSVPAEVVEAFFLGQGPAHLPPVDGKQPETVNLIARLSQKAPEWAHVSVKPALGQWCESYVTIRGTWCEPLNGEVIRQLNRRLREVHQQRQRSENSVAASAEPSP